MIVEYEWLNLRLSLLRLIIAVDESCSEVWPVQFEWLHCMTGYQEVDVMIHCCVFEILNLMERNPVFGLKNRKKCVAPLKF